MGLGSHARDALALASPAHVRAATGAWLRDRRGRGDYRLLDEDELRATRTSDTAFVFGSGRSLMDIDPAEWERIARCNTISLREFPRQQWVRADYHLTGEIDFLEPYAERIRANPRYADTVFVVQEGWRAVMGNDLVGRRLLPAGARVFRYHRRSRSRYEPPSTSFRRGLVHGFNSITDSVNFALVMGFRRVVLAGVDLYNKEYFWLPAGETRTYEKPGITAESLFTSSTPTIDLLGRWSQEVAARGVELAVLDPRSLLAGPLPVFSWGEPPSPAA